MVVLSLVPAFLLAIFTFTGRVYSSDSVVIGWFGPVQVGLSELNDQCLRCICFAASQCDSMAECNNGYCGPFRVGEDLWVDAGKPVLEGDNSNSKEAFTRCVNNYDCAAKAVKRHLKRNKKDCNDDGLIDCMDYAWIHHMGTEGCFTKKADFLYRDQFYMCLYGETFNQSSCCLFSKLQFVLILVHLLLYIW